MDLIFMKVAELNWGAFKVYFVTIEPNFNTIFLNAPKSN